MLPTGTQSRKSPQSLSRPKAHGFGEPRSTAQPKKDLQTSREALAKRLALNNRVGLGWLTFSCSVDFLDYWLERIEPFFRGAPKPLDKGWNGYPLSYGAIHGIVIAFAPVLTQDQRDSIGAERSPNEGRMTVNLPQSALDSLRPEDVLRFWLAVFGCEPKFSRADVYYDDYCKIMPPEQLHKSLKRGGIAVPRFVHVRGWDEYHHQKGEGKGFTVYIGSSRSEKQIRHYDKFQESGGKQDCHRLELQVRKTYAEAFGKYMESVVNEACNQATNEAALEAIANGYKSVIKGQVDFREIPRGMAPSELPRNWASRSKKPWWWQEMLAGLEPAKLVRDVVKPSMERRKAWIEGQVFKPVAVYLKSRGLWGMPVWAYLKSGLEEAEERFTKKDLDMLHEAMITSPA